VDKYNKHSINKVFLEVNTNSKKQAYYLKDNIDVFIKTELFPLLENYFDTLDKKNPTHSIQIEKLDFDLSVHPDLDFDLIKLEVINRFKTQIEQQIEKGFSSTDEYTLINNEEKQANGFFFFLETGTTPWWSHSKNTSSINFNAAFQETVNDTRFSYKISNALSNPIVRSRFIKQFTDEQIFMILKKGFVSTSYLDEKKQIILQKIKDNIQGNISNSKLTLNQRNLVWEITLLTLLDKNDSEIIKQKLMYLISSLIKSDIKNSVQNVPEQINELTKNKSVFDIVSNLANIVLILESILKDKLPKIKKPIPENLKDFYKSDKESNQNNASNIKSSIDNKPLESDPKKLKKIEGNLKDTLKSSIENIPIIFVNKKSENNKEEYVNDDKEIKELEILDVLQFQNEEKTTNVSSNYYIDNAGLLLIHPFLKQLFENCKLLNKDNTISDPEVAAYLLHYIATKREQDYENTMLLEKFLCNIPINQSINRNILLPEEFKNHGNEMLQAILGHWPAMKNSSIDLLRNEYLQRPGKLILSEENPKIIVERKIQDILLDKITWNLSVIKLAWKNKIIFVEW
jgi:hypothetical protein